jgi:hypothetical protein
VRGMSDNAAGHKLRRQARPPVQHGGCAVAQWATIVLQHESLCSYVVKLTLTCCVTVRAGRRSHAPKHKQAVADHLAQQVSGALRLLVAHWSHWCE